MPMLYSQIHFAVLKIQEASAMKYVLQKSILGTFNNQTSVHPNN